MNILETKDLTYSYQDGTLAVDGINIEIETGKKIAFIGQNGSGKSTLFLLLNGTLKPNSGEILLNGIPFRYNAKSLREIRKKIGVVFQNSDDQIFAPTVYDDVAFGPRNLEFRTEEVVNSVNSTLGYMGLMKFKDKPPHYLSGGQKKKVAIAGVVAMEPDVIILDEPLSNLDPVGADEVVDLLNEFNHSGKTIIISTHDVDLASTWADVIYVINRGQIRASGHPRSIFSDRTLIEQSKLRLPTIVETYREFEARGIAEGHIPMTILDLVDSMEGPITDVRCAVADCLLEKGQKVGLIMREGTIFALADIQHHITGRTLADAAPGNEVLVEDVTGSLISETGNIHVLQIPRVIEGGSKQVDLEWISGMMSGFDRVGAMGTSAKVTAKKAGFHLNFEVDVIQSAMLSALRGFNCLVLASGGMADLVMERINERNKSNNRQIQCSIEKI